MSAATLLEPKPAAMPLLNGEALYEIVNGQRVELPPMSVYSSWLTSRLSYRLGPFAELQTLGHVVVETLFILDPKEDLRRRPDLAFVSKERWPLDKPIPETGDWQVVPDVAIEVSSPNDIVADLLDKIEEYFVYKVRQVWLVLPSENKVYIYHSPKKVDILTVTDELDGGDIIPGFRLKLADLFRNPAVAVNA